MGWEAGNGQKRGSAIPLFIFAPQVNSILIALALKFLSSKSLKEMDYPRESGKDTGKSPSSLQSFPTLNESSL